MNYAYLTAWLPDYSTCSVQSQSDFSVCSRMQPQAPPRNHSCLKVIPEPRARTGTASEGVFHSALYPCCPGLCTLGGLNPMTLPLEDQENRYRNTRRAAPLAKEGKGMKTVPSSQT